MTDPAQSFVNTLQGKQQLVRNQKQAVLPKIAAAKQAIFNFAPKIIPSYSNVTVPSYDDVVAPTYDHIYTEETSPLTLPPVINQEGNIREHTDGTFSVIEDDGFIQPFKDEQTAHSYGAYKTAKDEARRQGAPEPGSAGDVANKLLQGTFNLFGMGYTGAVGTGQTLRHQIDDYNSRGPWKTPVVQLGREDQGTKWYKITEEDESRFNNIEQLPSEIQKLYRQSLKYKILTELKRRADETKEDLAVAEERVETVLEKIPVDRTTEAVRDAEFAYVAETEGLWEATKHTLKEDWTSYLYGGIDAIPYMAVLATGNVPAITTLVTSMAIGNNVENTKEFLKLNDGREPTQDEAARIQLFSVTQAAVDAIGDRLALAGLPKAVKAALSKRLISAKKVLSSTAKSVPPVFKNFAVRTVAKVATAPAKMIVAEAPAGIAEETSRQLATEGRVSDPAAILQAGIIEGLAAPVAAPTVRVGAAVGKAVKKAVKGKEVDTPVTTGTTETTEGIKPPLPIEQAEFDTLIDSVVYVEGGDQTENIKTLHELRKRELTSTQEEIHAKKVTELKNKINNKTANTNPVDDEGNASLENVVNLTEEEFKEVEKELTESEDSKEEDKAYLESISKLITAKKRAEASISTVSEDIREGEKERHKGASTLFSEVKTLVNSLVAPNANPGQIHRAILTKINELQTHSGNLEKKEEAFRKAENYVVDKSKKTPEDAELVLNKEILDKDGEVKPRVGTGNSGDAIVIATTKNRSTTYTVYYNQSRAEIEDANIEHEGYVTEITRLKTGESSINNLVNAVAEDSKYVDAVATAATAYLESTIYADTKNRVVVLKSEQATIAALAEQEYNRKTTEVTEEELETIDVETEPTRTGKINVFWGKPESNESTRILSNLAPRTFTYEGKEYGSVEHAYQSNKSGTFDQAIYDEYLEIEGFGRKIQGKASIDQLKKADSLGLMKKLVVESFIQNPDSKAAAKLMQYAEFTHDNDGEIDQAFLDGLYLAQKSLDKSAQDAADAKEVDEGSQTTPAEENVTEEASVAPEEQITAEVPIEELTEEEIKVRMNAYDLELKRRSEAREKAQAAEQEATPPVAQDTTTTPPASTTETIHGVSVTYTEVDDDAIPSLAANSNEQGIKIRKNITVDSVINYMLGNHVQGDKGKQAKVDVKNEVTAKINEEYGVNFLEILKGLSNTEIRNFILLHEYRHTQQRDKRDTTEEFIADYNANKVTFEKDANVYALKRMQLLPGKLSVTEGSTVAEKTITYNPKGKDTQTYTIRGSKIFNKNNIEVFKGDSVDRNKIFANLAVKEGRAQIVKHDGKKYVVNDKQQIMSVATGNIMKWAENHGTRKAILEQIQPVQESVQESSEAEVTIQPSSEVIEKEGATEFNNLPSKSSTPTMTYAGIGSRATPASVLKAMTDVAKMLESRGYTLNTGKTFSNKEEGADKAFSDGTTQKNLFSPEVQGSRIKEQTVAKEMHPAPSRLKSGGLKLMARNTNQIFGDNLDTPVDFVLFYAEETNNPLRPKGGTGQAVEMARRKGIPTINMADTNWKNQLEKVLGSQPTQQSSEVSFKLDNNLSLQESELDVHTLSVLFPAAINADGTLKTGDTADAAVNKLGKFLEVCK